MRLPASCIIMTVAYLLSGITGAATPSSTPAIFAPNGIAGAAEDGTATFNPDGTSVFFMRGRDNFVLMESHRIADHWSTPKPAPFSGQWRDLDPAMAPDGSFMLFVSNRPEAAGDQPIDEVLGRQRRVGHGMNLWRVDRRGGGWAAPVRLPDVVNRCSVTFAPSVAADGTVYFIGCAAPDDSLRLMRSVYRDGRYQAPCIVVLGGADARIRDPAIAPDGSFIVVSIYRATQQQYRLAIAFHTSSGWSTPLDLGDSVNGGKHSMGSQLGPDQQTLYFYSDRRLPPGDRNAAAVWNNGNDHIWQVSLAPWLDTRAN